MRHVVEREDGGFIVPERLVTELLLWERNVLLCLEWGCNGLILEE